MAAYEMVAFDHVMDAKDDKLGRGDVWWDNVWLKTPDEHLDALETIKDQAMQSPMSATYKPALMLSIAEALKEFDAEHVDASRVELPFSAIAKPWQSFYEGADQEGIIQHTRPGVEPSAAVPHLRDTDATPEQLEEGIRQVMTKNGPLRHIKDPESGYPLFSTRKTEHGEWKLQMPAAVAKAVDDYRPLVVSGAGEAIQRFLEKRPENDRTQVERFVRNNMEQTSGLAA